MRISDNYGNIRNHIKSGDVILWASDSFIGNLIRFFTKAPVNHASLVLRLDEWSGLKDRVFLMEALQTGIVLRLLSKRLSEYEGMVYWKPLNPKYDAKREAITEWALKQFGTKYDYGSLFRQILGRVNKDADRLFCSEYVHMAYSAGGVPVPGGPAANPGEIMNWDVLMAPVRIY